MSRLREFASVCHSQDEGGAPFGARFLDEFFSLAHHLFYHVPAQI